MFSSKERRGILILLPALLVSAWVVRRALSPHADEAARPYVDAAFAADSSGHMKLKSGEHLSNVIRFLDEYYESK